MPWAPESFERASFRGPVVVAGYVYRGLGLYMAARPSPKGRRPAEWNLIHLGSGRYLHRLRGSVATAFPVATEIAEAGDWDFLSLDGWRDRFPDAPDRVREIVAKHPKVVIGDVGGAYRDHEVARQIAMNRP